VRFSAASNQPRRFENFHLLLEKFNNLYVETDMRAMYNPSRMTVIQNATKKLVER
jgi:hypothetical protein